MSAAADTNTVLTPRQRDVLLYLCKGLRNAEIGALIGISERTVKMYVRQLFDAFEVTNRTELAGLASGPRSVPRSVGPVGPVVSTDEPGSECPRNIAAWVDVLKDIS